MTPDDLRARLLHRDASLLILDKPAGLPVHPGPGGGPSLEDHLDALRFGLPRRPALAHRLDRPTSGCLVLGRHRKALARLGRLFANGQVDKVYWAVVVGTPPADEGQIDLPLGRRSTDPRRWWMQVDCDGQPAVTDYRVIAGGPGAVAEVSGSVGGGDGSASCADLTWLELRPRTGRTHQLRVHLAALGCPILGDPIYGLDGPASPVGAARPGTRGGPSGTARSVDAVACGHGERAPAGPSGLYLHARAIGVPLYPNRPPITAEAPLPAHMKAVAGRWAAAAEGAVRAAGEPAGPS